MSELHTIETLDREPFKHMVATLGNLPTAFVDSMSYYECIAWLANYIKTQVIPAINNNAEATAELQAYYVELKGYVDNYFDNLDVQEEINNKLDDMAEAGTLQEIIEAYIKLAAVLVYPTIDDMKEATNLVKGSVAKTLGYYAQGDDGGATYIVTDTLDVNAKQETLDNGLYANLITYHELNVNTFGCYGDATHDDTTAFQAAVNYAIANGLEIVANGDYLLSDTITFTGTTSKKITINKIHTSNLGNKPLLYFDHGRYDIIRINTITGEKINVPNITNSYNHQSAFLLYGTFCENIKVEKIENFVCGFVLYSTGGSGSEGSYYNEISCKKCDTFYFTHFFGYNGCINGNTFLDSLHYITEWTNPNEYDQYTIVNESTGDSPVYVNNHNNFEIMVEKIATDDVSYYIANLNDSNSFMIDINRIEINGGLDTTKLITTNSQSTYNWIKINSGWLTIPNNKVKIGNNNIITAFNNFKYGLVGNKFLDSEAGTLNANFEAVANNVSDGHIVYSYNTRTTRINGMFKNKVALTAWSTNDFCTLNYKPNGSLLGVGVVYLADSGTGFTLTQVGTIKQVFNSYTCRISVNQAIPQDSFLFVDFTAQD